VTTSCGLPCGGQAFPRFDKLAGFERRPEADGVSLRAQAVQVLRRHARLAIGVQLTDLVGEVLVL
jgi:hypothetical protein